MLANNMELSQRSPGFVFQALKLRQEIYKLIDDPVRFCLINPLETVVNLSN